ncbi:class II fructose-bisphosphatase [Celerinatantimonas sp. YJH-8]|uniref:class II fructose-bisphosphatase n=1 Tax=Celerinatantimonas sp. YJH-8 TaxID=3228714 RepID=UPI0038C87170
MNEKLAFRFAEVTEAAALAGYQWLGRGNKNEADGAAVAAMREQLNDMPIDGEIVIGEGEIDEAPMLYIGERIGMGGDIVEIAVDPIEGTRMTAMGQSNAITVLAAGEKDCFLRAPDMYMEKLVVGPKAKGMIDLNLSLMDNLQRIADVLEKPLANLTVVTLAKPRHDHLIESLYQQGVRVFAIPDGDVAASILTCIEQSDVDVMYCIGGAPEGVVSAAVVRALGGDMQARLLPRDQVKGSSVENQQIAATEIHRCQMQGLEVNQVLTLSQLVSSDRVIFSATGITQGDLLRGIWRDGQGRLNTETLVVDGITKVQRRIQSVHMASREL